MLIEQNKMRVLIFVFFVTATLIGCTSSGAEVKSINIAVAANMQFAMDSIAVLFEKEYNIKCDVSTNSSGMLTAQIENGAPYDVFVSANMRYPNKLVRDGLASPPYIYAHGRLVFVYSSKEEYQTIEDALDSEKIRRVAIAEKKTAPYGTAAIEYLESVGKRKKYASKIVYGESVGQVNQYLRTNAVDAVFTSYSFVTKFNKKYHFIEVDQHHFTKIQQGVVIVDYGAKNNAEESKLFVSFLKSQRCKAVLEHFGYFVK